MIEPARSYPLGHRQPPEQDIGLVLDRYQATNLLRLLVSIQSNEREPLSVHNNGDWVAEMWSLLVSQKIGTPPNLPYPSTETCGAQEWAYDDDDEPFVYGTCQKPEGHPDRWHIEMRNEKLWAEWSGLANKRAPEDARDGAVK